ncbi:MAG: hypothetical protein EOM70_04960 [Clostridia bacterium]|nr:hypothetical protein [Clostridia bacterium]
MAGSHPACSDILAGQGRLRNSPPDGSLPPELHDWDWVDWAAKRYPACSDILAGLGRLRNSPPDGSLPPE